MPSNNTEQKAVNLGQLKMAYEAGALLPVDIATLTPQSTFRRNAVLGINGVLYRALRDTAAFPVTLTVADGEFVTTATADGHTAYVVSNATLSQDWEVWTDAAVDYHLAQLAARTAELEDTVAALRRRLEALEALTGPVTYSGHTYQYADILNAMAMLMQHTVVVQA